MISCILLAAGFSFRFNAPKALAHFQGGSVIEHLQKELLKSRLDEIIIVLGAHAERIKPLILNHKTIKLVYNKDYNLGQTSSFKAGLSKADEKTNAFMLVPVDYPLLSAATFDFLVENFNKKKCKILVPTFNKKRGHPPIFDASLKQPLLALDNDTGINTVIHEHEKETAFLPVKDAGVIKTFNTKEEFESIRAREII